MDPVRVIPDRFKHQNVSVWWDMKDCPLPEWCEPNVIKSNFELALGYLGYDGAISSISAYKYWEENETDFSQVFEIDDVNRVPIHSGTKDTTIKMLMTHMLTWSITNKDQSSYLLLAKDRDYANTLFNLKLNNNFILLAHPGELLDADPLVDASDVVLDFNALFLGIGNVLSKQ